MANKKTNSREKSPKLNMEDITAAAEKLAADYTIFCDYMEQGTPKLSARTMRLGKKDCFELNHLLQCVPEQWKNAGRTQESYAEIDFFYYFSLHYGIFYPAYKSGGYLPVFMEKRDKFYRLTPVERYSIMLEYMLWEFQDDSHSIQLYISSYCAANKSSSDFSASYNCILSRIAEMDSYYMPMARLHCLFGLYHIEWKENPDTKDKNPFQTIQLTEIGTQILLQFFKANYQRYKDEENFVCSEHSLLAIPESDAAADFLSWNREEKDISFLLKVSLGSCVRKIRIDGKNTLDDLHAAIQEAVDFDNDHLYYFEIGFGKEMKRYFHSSCNDEPLIAEETELQELPLYEKSSFKYLFDFGDNWLFDIKVEKILPEKTKNYSITEKKGSNPTQYSNDIYW